MATAKKTVAKANSVRPAKRAQLTPQASGDPVATVAQATTKGPKSAEEALEEAKEHGDEIVRVHVPQGYRLTLDTKVEVAYGVDTIKMPRSHAEHWYSKAIGVTVL